MCPYSFLFIIFIICLVAVRSEHIKSDSIVFSHSKALKNSHQHKHNGVGRHQKVGNAHHDASNLSPPSTTSSSSSIHSTTTGKSDIDDGIIIDKNTKKSKYLIKEVQWNSSALTITSFYYNDDKQYIPSNWVRSYFSEQSTMWNFQQSSSSIKDRGIPFIAFNNSFNRIFNNTLQFPYESFDIGNIPCAIEMIGIVKLNIDSPFKYSDKHVIPSVGYGQIYIDSKDGTTWPCYYRGIYDNARSTERTFKHKILAFTKHYWNVLLYCPVPSNNHIYCKTIDKDMNNKSPSLLKMKVNIKLKHINVENSFDIIPNNYHINSKMSSIHNGRNNPDQIAVCTVNPYTSKYTANRQAVNSMIFEFVRHYTNLGIKVILYDRDSEHHEHLLQTSYAKKQIHLEKQKIESDIDVQNPHRRHLRVRNVNTTHSISSEPLIIQHIHDNFHYYNYTLLTSVVPELQTIQHDNSEGMTMPMLIFDNDRILTSTHCRFDAKARYGITRVIVVDFDEFLYCRPAESNAKSQSQYFHNVINLIERQGYHQVALQQRILGSKDIINELTKISSLSNSGNALSPSILAGKLVNISMVDCILKQQHGNRSSSIFDCLTPYRISYEQGNYKSISINNPCLLTNFHHVCPLSHKDVRSMDCLCSTTFTSDHCVFIHFGFRDRFYQAINKFAKGLLSSTESKGINQLSTISTTTANG